MLANQALPFFASLSIALVDDVTLAGEGQGT